VWVTTPEGKVKDKVKKVLKKYDAYWHCPVQNGMGSPSLDFVGCFNSKYYAIETKAGNKMPTPRQETTIAEMEAVGAKVFVINEVTGTTELEEWLDAESKQLLDISASGISGHNINHKRNTPLVGVNT
jgi:hypothetical protein